MRSRGKLWDWLTVTRVCKYWRNVALGCPGLWNDIRNFSDYNKIRAFLERSGEAELKVALRLSFHIAAGTITTLLKGHMWRVREFRVTVVYYGWDCVQLRLAELTERAKVVELYHENSRDGDGGMLSNMKDNALGVKLYSLSLNSVAFQWSSYLYHGLSRLTIIRPISPPSIFELKGILEHCPGLRHLTLISAHPILNDSEVTLLEKGVPKADLPFLESVNLVDIPVTNCTYLFAIANIATNVRLHMICDYPFHSPLPLPPMVYEGREPCQRLFIVVSDTYFKFCSNVAMDDNTESSAISILIGHPDPLHFYDMMASFAAILSSLYWKSAEFVTISFSYTHGSEGTSTDQINE